MKSALLITKVKKKSTSLMQPSRKLLRCSQWYHACGLWTGGEGGQGETGSVVVWGGGCMGEGGGQCECECKAAQGVGVCETAVSACMPVGRGKLAAVQPVVLGLFFGGGDGGGKGGPGIVSESARRP
jgi:hypothetical protein